MCQQQADGKSKQYTVNYAVNYAVHYTVNDTVKLLQILMSSFASVE